MAAERRPPQPDRARRQAGPRTPESAAQALSRARLHARRAVGEALAAGRALLDAAALGWSGRPGEAHAALRGLAELLDEQTQRFRDGDAGVPAPVINAMLAALDQEILRWEKRAARDPDARAVLRTFLGVREILWEFGLRRDDAAPAAFGKGSAQNGSTPNGSAGRGGKPDTAGASKRHGRVQRVEVQG